MRGYDRFLSAAGESLAIADSEDRFTWDRINEIFSILSPDRRYKIWFCAGTDSHGIVRVGRQEYLYRFCGCGESSYLLIRAVSDADIYKTLPAHRIERLYGSGSAYACRVTCGTEGDVL